MAAEIQGVVLSGPSQTVIEGVKQGEIIACPDPSAHEKHAAQARLQEQASKAALYVTHPEKYTEPAKIKHDEKLSSAGASTSLKHARAQDLPGYPSSGGLNAAHSHSAANLANTNHKPYEPWQPNSSTSAGKAALLAHDNQRPIESWQPELSAAGSKAALLAHRGSVKSGVWQPEPTKEGNSAAHIAMAKKGLSPEVDLGYTEESRKRALMAATGAVATSNARKRADSTPKVQPSIAGSLRGTTTAMRTPEKVDANSWSSDAMQAARIQHSHASREMYTEHPPVEIERNEAQHQAALRASAVQMAKTMYDQQRNNTAATAGAVGASSAHARNASSGVKDDDLRQAALAHLTLQEAAQRLAQEKLANMKTNDAAAFREYYNTDIPPQAKPNRSKMSLRTHRRTSSDATSETMSRDRWEDSDEEDMGGRRLRKQSTYNKSYLQDVDVKKQQNDRAALLAAAERKVQQQMLKMDDKVFNDTGKMSPAMMEEYENKARLRIQQQREAEVREREEVTSNAPAGQEEGPTSSAEKVHIGGNKFMTMAEIEAIARARINPTLAEIDEQAEKRRAEDAADRLDKDEQKRAARADKEREQERKLEEKRAKAEEKAQYREEKQAEKTRLKDEKRLAKEDKRRSRTFGRSSGTADRASLDAEAGGAAEPLAAEANAVDDTARAGVLAPAAADATGESAAEHSVAPIVAHGATAAAPVAVASSVPTTGSTADPSTTTSLGDAASDPVGVGAQSPAAAPTAASTPVVKQEPVWHGLRAADPATITTDSTSGVAPIAPTAESTPRPSADVASGTPKASTDSKPTISSGTQSVTPEKSGFRGLFSKLKRKTKSNPGEIQGFAGGHRLHKPKPEKTEDSGVSGLSTVGATDDASRPKAESVSSLSSSDGEEVGRATPTAASTAAPLAVDDEEEESRGRQRTSTKPALAVAPPQSSVPETQLQAEPEAEPANRLSKTETNTSGAEEFEEARDQFDEAMAPPQPAFTSQAGEGLGDASPHRDSKFIEDV